MPLVLRPVFQPAIIVPDLGRCGFALLAEIEVLDRLADQHGLTRLSAFADTRPIPPPGQGAGSAEPLLPAWTHWFVPARRRLACERLARLVSRGTIAATLLATPPLLVAAELRLLANALAAAEAAGARFRLEIFECPSAS